MIGNILMAISGMILGQTIQKTYTKFKAREDLTDKSFYIKIFIALLVIPKTAYYFLDGGALQFLTYSITQVLFIFISFWFFNITQIGCKEQKERIVKLKVEDAVLETKQNIDSINNKIRALQLQKDNTTDVETAAKCEEVIGQLIELKNKQSQLLSELLSQEILSDISDTNDLITSIKARGHKSTQEKVRNSIDNFESMKEIEDNLYGMKRKYN